MRYKLVIPFLLSTAAMAQTKVINEGPFIPNCSIRMPIGTVCKWNPPEQLSPVPPCLPETLPGTVCVWPQPFNTVGKVATYGTLVEKDDSGMAIRSVAIVYGLYYDERMWEYGHSLGAYTNCIGESVKIQSSLSSWNVRIPFLNYGASGTLWNGCQQ